MPKLYSRSGPVLIRSDLNSDGLQDLVSAGAQGQPTQVFLQTASAEFKPTSQLAFIEDATYEDVDLALTDLNDDKHLDLLIASGGNGYPDGDTHYALRYYLNDGQGIFSKAQDFPLIISNAQCLAVADLNQDGFSDIFLGTGYKAQQFPLAGENYVLLNDGSGHFALTGDLPFVNDHVMDAIITDYDQDGFNELILVGEWEPLSIYSFQNGGWKLEHQSQERGWFNTVYATNLDNDPEFELVVGNLGLNSQWIATPEKPIINYYGDFDQNQTIDPILSCYIGEGSYPLVSRDDLIGQVPSLKKFFTSYKDYAQIDMAGLLKNLPNPSTDTINDLRTVIFDVQADGLQAIPLPVEAQIAPVYAIHSIDFDNDGDEDILLAGNNEFNRVKLGEMNANHGILLRNDGDLHFTNISSTLTGLNVRGDTRTILPIKIQNHPYLIFGINNRDVETYKINSPDLIH
ncbi:MAG: VCBS repeat-containing protein [Saprospiraceae bacterium]|nr:VCBS repeat-containing protein [Saprospiraceae bacterium]